MYVPRPVIVSPQQPLNEIPAGSRPGIETVGFPDQTAEYRSSPSTPTSAVPHVAVEIPGYEILAVLGRGGMGVVYQARQIQLKRMVALKMIRAGDQADEAELARFRIEAESVARLQHPNIVQIHEV